MTNLSLNISYSDDDEVLFLLTGMASKMAIEGESPIETVFSAQIEESSVGRVRSRWCPNH